MLARRREKQQKKRLVQLRRRPQIFGRSLEESLTRARRSSIPLPKRRPSLPALPWVGQRRRGPTSRSRRRAAASGCGGTAFRPCAAGAATASRAARRGRPRSGAAVPKAGRGLSRLSGPSLKARARGRSPALRGRPGRAPTVLRFLSGPLGVSRDEGTTRPRLLRLGPSVLPAASISRFSRARARGRGIPGALGARDSSSGGLVFGCGRAAVLRMDRALPPSGGGRAH